MSGLIPQPFIDDLLQRTDLVELIDSYVPLKKRGNSHVACCPFHNEKSPSFNVVAKKQFYHCFGCGASGNAISFVMKYFNQGFVDAIETLATRIGLTIPREKQTEKENTSRDLYKLLSAVSLHYRKKLKHEGQPAINYLRERGLSGEVAKLYQLGFATEGWHNLEKAFPRNQRELIATGMLIKNEDGKIYDRYRNRIMFPIHDRHGRIIGFGGRVLDSEQKPKYLNSPETVIFQKSRELYGLHQVLSQQKSIDSIIIVEGYMDVIALAQHEIINVVATLGTATSTYHIQLLSKHAKSLIFCFDGDNAGKQAAWRGLESSLPHLNLGLDVSFMFLPDGHDPDSLVRKEGKEHFLNQIKQAIPLNRFFFDSLSKDLNLLRPAGKTQLINLAKPFLQKMSEGSYKQLLIGDLARLTHIEPHRLNQLITDQTKNPSPEPMMTLTRTPMRIAVALLLQHPEIYTQSMLQMKPELFDAQEHEILLKLLNQLASNPKANTATLIEAWRNHPYFDFINKLAAWEHQVPEPELVKEFIDIMFFLQKQNRELTIRQLINKSRQHGLNEAEKFKLQEMLKERHT
ncbi:DNA primase [Legionella longbeachae]|uniref:DNA primase n=1 Tax=Legionella longbeachae serogroup 1 (strain NSW150) TaxID=661367 RepID=D3HLH3_LEGLN|nr:DNA primase [Legionella longbeachae]VEE03798.1 DNA primase [Legionella oakridgensis]HBD7397400.1 DNA primase [Legionella pneumophila]ARB93330.1 DNA primase [Legionella longbeachae]ARM33567.1 DNA primase [Legionella longbeachae]EEZ93567.1 DNA primase [Legionella longbeachae D-4968]